MPRTPCPGRHAPDVHAPDVLCRLVFKAPGHFEDHAAVMRRPPPRTALLVLPDDERWTHPYWGTAPASANL